MDDLKSMTASLYGPSLEEHKKMIDALFKLPLPTSKWDTIKPTIYDNTKEEQMSEYDCWEVAEAVIGVSQRVLLRGKPGTGKTYHAASAALEEGQKVYSITMTEETPAAEIRGHYTIKDGEYVWSDGPAIMAWREGARLVINEIDRASEDCMSLMYAILDDPGFAQLTLPTGETVRPQDGFQIVATMNGIPEDLPDALQDRLPVDIEITDVHPKAIERLPEDLREPARNTALAKTSERGISIRMWLEFAALRETLPAQFEGDEAAEKGLEMAAMAVFGGKYRDALTALKIGEEASAPQTMDGYIVTLHDQRFLKAVRSDCKVMDELGWDELKQEAQFDTLFRKHPEQTMYKKFKYDPSSISKFHFQRNDDSWAPIDAV